MDGFLRADKVAANLLGSPTSSYMADDAASTCNLINPSPPTNALVNPVPAEQEDESLYNIGEELATKLQKVQGKCDPFFYIIRLHFIQEIEREFIFSGL